jgi:hypothetical protein
VSARHFNRRSPRRRRQRQRSETPQSMADLALTCLRNTIANRSVKFKLRTADELIAILRIWKDEAECL